VGVEERRPGALACCARQITAAAGAPAGKVIAAKEMQRLKSVLLVGRDLTFPL